MSVHEINNEPDTLNMSFSAALRQLKKGKMLARSGWNGKNMCIFYVGRNSWHADIDLPRQSTLPFIAMRTVQAELVPWLASQTDILAEDWTIV